MSNIISIPAHVVVDRLEDIELEERSCVKGVQFMSEDHPQRGWFTLRQHELACFKAEIMRMQQMAHDSDHKVK